MTKIRRYLEPGYPYFITTNTCRRQAIFFDEKICKILLVTLEYFKLVLDYKIYAYCLMPDHLHIILQPIGAYNLSYIMRMIKGNFSRKYNKLVFRSGKVWQERFFDEGIRDNTRLIKKIEYIHNNPVRAKIVVTPDEYKFSSYGHYFNTGHRNNIFPEIDQLE